MSTVTLHSLATFGTQAPAFPSTAFSTDDWAACVGLYAGITYVSGSTVTPTRAVLTMSDQPVTFLEMRDAAQ